MESIRIDSHQHFWNYDPKRHTWMSDEMTLLKNNFLPPDLLPYLQKCNLDACVAVQAEQSEDENTFLLNLAENFDFIKGIVGWVDFQADNLEERLSYYSQFPKMKGFRHILQDEQQRDFMLRPAFLRGISKLEKYNFSYDILIFTDQLPYALDFVKAFPQQSFVIDHLAKPLINKQIVGNWRTYIEKIASYKNVYCKISGMVTEADWKHWKKEDFKIYLDSVVEAFGIDRLMYGSDWPVCTLAANYGEQFAIIQEYFSSFSRSEQDQLFGRNASSFYHL